MLLRVILSAFYRATLEKTLPGCVTLGEKFAFFSPTAGRRAQLFHPIFTQPGVQPCTSLRTFLSSDAGTQMQPRNVDGTDKILR